MPARNLTPQQALEHLMEGNKRFVADTPSHPNQNSKHRSTLTDHPVSYTHLTLPTTRLVCRSRWSPYH